MLNKLENSKKIYKKYKLKRSKAAEKNTILYQPNTSRKKYYKNIEKNTKK